jgi:ABC-type antimicrobial peptide transport system ATPase subunit
MSFCVTCVQILTTATAEELLYVYVQKQLTALQFSTDTLIIMATGQNVNSEQQFVTNTSIQPS